MLSEYHRVGIGDLDLAYVEQGQGSPVVFVHGGGPTDLRTWSPQMGPFAEQHRAIAYSQRYPYPNPWVGDGSDMNSAFTHAADLAELIGTLQLGPVHLVGNSYGADIALRFAVERPDLLRTLVLEEPALLTWLVALPGGEALFAEMVNNIMPARRAVQEGDLAAAVRLFMVAVQGGDMFDQLPTATKDRLMDNARLIGFEPIDNSEVTDITPSEAAAIQVPTLLLTGDHSPEMFVLVSRELARHVPNVEQAQIERASHVLHYMNAESFNRTVLAFLAQNS